MTNAHTGRGTSRLTKPSEVHASPPSEVQAMREVQACPTGGVQGFHVDPSCDSSARRVRYKRISTPEKYLYLTRCEQNGLYLGLGSTNRV